MGDGDAKPVDGEKGDHNTMSRARHGTASEGGGEHLLARVATGESAPFGEWCARLEAPLFTYLLRLVGDRTEAEDLTQEAFLRVFRMARERRLRGDDASGRALLFTIAHNLAMDSHRRVRNVVPLKPSDPPPASTAAERALLRRELDKALGDLPEAQRSALMLREFGGLSYGDIARALDANEGRVKTWLYRARRKLAELLDREGQYIGEQHHGL